MSCSGSKCNAANIQRFYCFTLCIEFYQLRLSHLKRLEVRHAEFHSTQISYRCSLKAMIHTECCAAVWLGNISHSRNKICKWGKISVTAKKMPSVQTFSRRTTGLDFGYNSAEGEESVKCYELHRAPQPAIKKHMFKNGVPVSAAGVQHHLKWVKAGRGSCT